MERKVVGTMLTITEYKTFKKYLKEKNISIYAFIRGKIKRYIK